MPARVNTKFVVILIALIVLAVLGVAGVVYYRGHRDPTDFLTRADAFMAQHEYALAAQQYQNAINRRQGDIGILMKLADAQAQTPLDSADKAKIQLTGLIRLYASGTQADPGNPVPLQRLLDLYLSLGEEGDPNVWDTMFKQAKTSLSRSPDMLLAKKYRGIAQVGRMRKLQIPLDERITARKDLEAAHEHDPNDQSVMRYLAELDLSDAQALDRSETAKIAKLRKDAVEMLKGSQAAHADDVRRKIDYYRVLRATGDNKEAGRVLSELEAAMLKDPSQPGVMAEVVQLVMSLDTGSSPATQQEAIKRATALVNAGVTASPDDLRLQMLRGHLLSREDPPTEAMKTFKKVADAAPHGSAMELLRSSGVANMALLRYTDLLIGRIEKTPETDPNRAKMIEEATATIDHRINISDIAKTTPVNLLEGRLALVRGQWREALSKLNMVSAAAGDASPEVLLYVARACIQLNELGEATRRLRQVTDLVPAFLPARYELAQLYLRSNQIDEANKQIDAALKAKPDDERSLILRAGALAQAGKAREAIAVLNKLKPAENTEVATMLARLQASQGQTDQARKLLEGRLAADPKDIRVLLTLLSVVEDKDQKLKYIEASRKAGGDARALDVLEQQLGDAKALPDSIEKMIAAEPAGVDRQLKLYQFYRQTNQRDKAAAALAEAAKNWPDHATVISLRFDEALAAKDWSQADTLVRRATELNLDQAEGAFYQGRLELARGRFENAATRFSKGLTAQPVFSLGWRLKGDALRLGGDLPGALEAYTKAIEQQPANIEALRGAAITRDGLGQYDQALVAIRKAYNLAPNDPELAMQYLAYEQEHGDKALVLNYRRQIAQSNPKDILNRRLLAMLLARMKQPDEAIKTVDALVAQSPDDLANVTTAATVRQMLGRPDEGRQMLQAYIEKKGDKAIALDWTTFAQFLLNLGDESAGMAAYRRAMTLEDPKTLPVTRELADTLFDHGQAEKSVELYEKAAAVSPNDKNLMLRWAEGLVRSKRYDEAEKHLAALGKDTDAATVLLLRAMIARGRGDRAKALALLNQAAEASPQRAAIYFERALVYAGDPTKVSEMIADLRKYLELNPGNPVAVRMLAEGLTNQREYEEAARLLQNLLSRYPNDAQVRLQLFNVYILAKQITAGTQLLNESAKMFPQDPTWPRLQARVMMMQPKFDPEPPLQKLREAYKLSSNSPAVLEELAQLLVEVRRPAPALELLRDQSDAVEKSFSLRAVQGRALWLNKQTDQATVAFAKAMELAQSYEQVMGVVSQMAGAMGAQQTATQLKPLSVPPRKLWIEMALAQFEMGAGQNSAAAARLHEAEALVPNGTGVQLIFLKMLASARYQANDFEEAVVSYRALLDLAPNDPETINNLAYLLSDVLHRPQEALPLAERAARLLPESAPVLDTLGWVQYQAGDKERAYNTLQRSVEKRQLSTNTYHLGVLYLERQQNGLARDMFNLAKKLATQSKDTETLEAVNKCLKELGP